MARTIPLALLAALVVPPAAGASLITVETLLDADVADGNCSLREAIVAANDDAVYRDCPAGLGLDRIEIPLAGTLLLGADLPEIEESLEVIGPAAGGLILDGGDAFRPFLGAGGSGFVLRLENLTLRRGHAVDRGGCLAMPGGGDLVEIVRVRFTECASDDDGGAVAGFAVALTTIRESSFVGNGAGQQGGALFLNNFGAVTIEDSTFSGNHSGVLDGFGSAGAILVGSVDLTMRRSTVSGNSAAGTAGGIQLSGSGTSTIESSTIVGNLAGLSGSGGVGGGLSISTGAELDLANSVVAGNVDLTVSGGQADDIHVSGGGLPGVATSSGFNFVGSNQTAEATFPASPAPGLPNVHGDFVGTDALPFDAGLGPLANHGGPSRTHAPGDGSPLVDQGACAGSTRDQRGYFRLETGLRPVDDPGIVNFASGCDIGAFEQGATDADGRLHGDDFESGDTTAWSTATP